MRILIVANGELATGDSFTLADQDFNQIIAVDGGYEHCRSLGQMPDTLIGDLDSFADGGVQAGQLSEMTLIPSPSEKDESDLELALLHAVEIGAVEIIVLAGLGGRIDMSLANLGLLAMPQLKGVHVEFWHNGQRIWLIQPPGGEIHGAAGDTVSLLPFHGDARGIRTTNLAYSLQNEDLPLGPARGVSNVLEAEIATIALARGALLVVWTRGRA